jgi:DNA-binding CsgD family transcriptional regulator
MAAAEELDDEWLLSRVLCVAGVVDFLLGRAHAVELLQRAVQLEGDTVPMGVVRLPSYFLANVLRWMDDFDSARRRLEALRLLAFELGTDASVYDVLFELSELECWAGRYGLALDYVDEMQDAAEMVGWAGSWAASARALVEAHLGRADTSRVAAERSLALATSQGDARVEAKTLAVLGFLELSLGDASAARRHLDRVAELTQRIEEPGVFRVAADHVESLVAVGDLREAKARLERFEEQSMSRARPWAEVTSARCRGLLLAASGQPEEALPSLDRAIEAHVALPMPLELGRTLLVQGEVLRRIRRKAAAKDSLERSLAIFEELGAKLWADRARAALRRVGLRPSAPLGLTETERRVADLAATGRTNREIADALFVSPKTVEANLARVYQKLGVRSKAQLAARVASRREAPGS